MIHYNILIAIVYIANKCAGQVDNVERIATGLVNTELANVAYNMEGDAAKMLYAAAGLGTIAAISGIAGKVFERYNIL